MAEVTSYWNGLLKLFRRNSANGNQPAVDPITGLPARGAVIAQLSRTLARAHHHTPVAMVIIEFSSMLETEEATDDRLILQLAKLLRSWIEPQHIVGRLRDREFALILSGLTMPEVERVADQVVDKVRTDPWLQDRRGHIATIVGVGYTWRADCPASQLMSLADIALHYARATGRSWHAIVDKGTAKAA
jgi:diguanylate cyclase (GGDEF)-like protein